MTNEPTYTWISLRAAASQAGVSTQTLRRLAKAGKVPCLKVGEQLRIRSDFIERLLEATREEYGLSAET